MFDDIKEFFKKEALNLPIIKLELEDIKRLINIYDSENTNLN